MVKTVRFQLLLYKEKIQVWRNKFFSANTFPRMFFFFIIIYYSLDLYTRMWWYTRALIFP